MKPNSHMLSEKALVERAIGGDEAAFECIMDRYQEPVTRVILSILQNPMDAEEVAQEVFITVFDKIDSCREEASFSIWVQRIAINAALRRKRSERARGYQPLQECTATSASGQGCALPVNWACVDDNPALHAEVRGVLRAAVERLEEKCRIVFLLRDIEEMSTAETAAVLGLGIAAVKTRLHRARLFLREELAVYLDPQVRAGEILR